MEVYQPRSHGFFPYGNEVGSEPKVTRVFTFGTLRYMSFSVIVYFSVSLHTLQLSLRFTCTSFPSSLVYCILQQSLSVVKFSVTDITFSDIL